jgi:hypothetical protein
VSAVPQGGKDFSSCAAVQCPAGQTCILEQVQCFVAPCPPIATCVPARHKRDTTSDSDDDPCASGARCPPDSVCVAREVVCKKAPCRKRAFCERIIEVGPPSCETVDCATGLKCVMRPVNCIQAPCYDQPFCVPA